jgi:pSer/pThr/pTyr-binding forkhead associated (FHA) protein
LTSGSGSESIVADMGATITPTTGTAELVPCDGGDAVPLVQAITEIGRGTAADVRIDDPSVSLTHALIVRSADQARIVDCGSLNGLRVNGEAVTDAALEDGDVIAVGRQRLMYAVGPGRT